MFSRKVITILIYIASILLLVIFQPSMMFDENGNMKTFDHELSDSTTLIPLILILPFLAILSYMLVLVLEMIFT